MAKILVIEDNVANRAALGMVLTSHGHEVFQAADGKQGLEKAQQVKPDLIVLDLMMPAMDGQAVLASLKGREDLRSAPVVVVTAAPVPADSSLEASAILQKPYDVGVLVGLVEMLCSRKGDA